ncbi:MAG: hypothetical protein V7707_08100 [Motiliproteus sp.]
MTDELEKKICGIVMPISSMTNCDESHWSDVLGIITEAIEAADFEGNLVSNSDEVGIIHKRIIQNLYDNPIVVCDVSCKNPNVMFELGLRLAFDKPTIIIKDSETSYSFDTSSIEHLEYPRDLRFTQIVEFKKLLTEKIQATYRKSTEDPNYTTFLKHFGEFKIAKIDQKEVSGQEFIIDELKNIKKSIRDFEKNTHNEKNRLSHHFRKLYDFDLDISNIDDKQAKSIFDQILKTPNIQDVVLETTSPGTHHISANIKDINNHKYTMSKVEKILSIVKNGFYTISYNENVV